MTLPHAGSPNRLSLPMPRPSPSMRSCPPTAREEDSRQGCVVGIKLNANPVYLIAMASMRISVWLPAVIAKRLRQRGSQQKRSRKSQPTKPSGEFPNRALSIDGWIAAVDQKYNAGYWRRLPAASAKAQEAFQHLAANCQQSRVNCTSSTYQKILA